MSRVIYRLSLTDFRAYSQLDLELAGQSHYFFGPNGAGKTNLLEAVSILNPGKGLRGAPFAELGSRSDKYTAKAWGVAAILYEGEQEVHLGTGSDGRDTNKRQVRIDHEIVPPARLSDHLRLVWLTPALDRLFIEARAERLRFFDRLIYAAKPSHAQTVTTYEKALRERLRLLCDGLDDPLWLDTLEAKLAHTGAHIMQNRREGLNALSAIINERHSAFPRALLTLIGDGQSDDPVAELMSGLKRSRSRDREAGRSLFGPHRADLEVVHALKNQQAALCSTGEQKALLLNLILAQGARLKTISEAPSPVMLLDEVAAHLDPEKRHALFDETTHLGLQTLFTGTDLTLFEGLKHRARGVRLENGQCVEFID